jgi:hypothetical protein
VKATGASDLSGNHADLVCGSAPARWDGKRWRYFQSPNVVCLEHYRRRGDGSGAIAAYHLAAMPCRFLTEATPSGRISPAVTGIAIHRWCATLASQGIDANHNQVESARYLPRLP